MSKLTRRKAIITGASQGLGRALAVEFARAGADVLLTARSAETLQAATQAALEARQRPEQIIEMQAGDVSSEADCRAWVATAQERFGGLDIVINNAGIYGPMGRIEENNWDDWLAAMQINCFGTILMCRAALPILRQQRYGKIVNLSGGGATAPLPRLSAYAASKAAVVRFTETLAEEVRDDQIDVNAVAPGPLNTRLLDQVLAAGPEVIGQTFYERSIKQRETGGASFEKAAELVVFLASRESDGITGRLLSAVWDDWRSLPSRREQLAGTDLFTLRRIVPQDRERQWKCA